MLSAGFSLLSLNSRGSLGNRHVRTAPVPVAGRLRRIPVGGSCSGSFSSPSSRSWSPFLSESWAGAGRAAAALTAPRLRLPSVPVVTCSRCSHNSARGRREMPRGRVNPWFLPLTLPLPPLAALFLYIPSQLAASAPKHPHGGGGQLFDPSFLHLFHSYTRFFFFPGTLPLNLFVGADLNVHIIKTYGCRDFPGGTVVETHLSTQGVWVPSLGSELGSHMPCGQKHREHK